MGKTFRFDRWWAWGVAFLSLAFSVWFIFVEREGLLRLLRFIGDGIVAIPGAIGDVISYYASVPAGPLLASMIVGGLFGGITTTLVYLSARNVIRVPGPSARSSFAAIAVGVFAYLLGIALLYAVMIAAAAALVFGYVFQPEMRDFISRSTLRRVLQPDALRLVGQGLFVGLLAGAIGAQILAAPMQHCTYTPEVSAIEQQIGIFVTAVSALLVLIPVWTVALRRGQRRIDQGTSGFFKGVTVPFVFLAPTLLSLIVFLYYPAVQVANLSLNRQRFRNVNFVCLENYVDIAGDTIYQNSFTVTLLLMVAIVIFGMSLALAISLLASQNVRGASIYRTLLIWPYALSPVVVGAIFLAMFRQGRGGLINYALYELTGETLDWLTDPNLAPWVIIFASVYNVLGFNILFYVAGLQNIPKDLLEAAQIDGANVVQRFVRITFPLLSPFTFFLLVTNVTYAFYGIYGAVDTLTQGGPPLGMAGQDGGATEVLIFKLYEDSFMSGAQLGSPAAQSIVLFLLVATMTLIQFRVVESRVTYSS